MEAFVQSSTGENNRRRFHKWHWTHEEDDLLTALVRQYGAGNWDYIANFIGGRTGKSCRLRWLNQLNPGINKLPFTEEEQQRLLWLHRKYGNKWATIVSFFPSRTDNQVKNQYHVLMGSRSMRSGVSPPPSNLGYGSTLEGRSVGSSRDGNVPVAPVGFQSSNVPIGGNSMPDQMPLSSGGSSSVRGRGFVPYVPKPIRVGPKSSNNYHLANIYHQARLSCAGSTVADAINNSVAPVAEPQTGGEAINCQFIDFLGVGNAK